jgi:Tfp pilus assembly ATPase PilU
LALTLPATKYNVGTAKTTHLLATEDGCPDVGTIILVQYNGFIGLVGFTGSFLSTAIAMCIVLHHTNKKTPSSHVTNRRNMKFIFSNVILPVLSA